MEDHIKLMKIKILAYINLNPRSSVRHLAREVGFYIGKVQLIKKKKNYMLIDLTSDNT